MNQKHLFEVISTLPQFALYFVVAIGLLLAFKYVYIVVTPHDEWKLIKDGNVSAALGFGGAILGFAIALGGVVSNSMSPLDLIIWGIVALLAQTGAFLLTRQCQIPSADNENTVG